MTKTFLVVVQSFKCHQSLSVLYQLAPEPGPWQLPHSLLSLRLRAVPACVRVVPGGCTDGAGVFPEDRADDCPVGWLQFVGPVHPCRLPVLPAETAEVWGSPAAAGVRQAADWTGLCGVLAVLPPRGLDVAPRTRCCCSLGARVSMVPLSPVTQPLQKCAQVHVVMPHVEAISVREEGALEPDLSLHSCNFWKKKICAYLCWSLSYL